MRERAGVKEGTTMKKFFSALLGLLLIAWVATCAPKNDLEIEGKKLISKKPPFTLVLPSEFRLTHSFSQENPKESSLTRVYFFVKEKDKQVEEMLILQIADKTNPQAEPITAPPLKPYAVERMYQEGKMAKGDLAVDYLIQLMAWNPEAPSLQPVIETGIIIPPHWTLQGQFLFIYLGEHAVFFRYSKDVNSFGIKVSEKGNDWGKGQISGNEKRAYETFQKTFMEMINSIQLKK